MKQRDADRVTELFIAVRRTVLKFGKSPTGDVVSTGNERNGFIITEVPVAPMRPGRAPPTALHPLPGNKEKGE